jgi:hypothetical protein
MGDGISYLLRLAARGPGRRREVAGDRVVRGVFTEAAKEA